MVSLVPVLFFKVQKILLFASYYMCRIFIHEDKQLWIVGVNEIANNTRNISSCFDKVYTVNFAPNRFYPGNHYDFDLTQIKICRNFIRWLMGPILLGYLAVRSVNFFYIGRMGFLYEKADGRYFEFSFLKKRNKNLITFFCGSDIRSPKLSLEHAKQHDIDVMATYQAMTIPHFLDEKYEELLKKVAKSADEFSDHIFNAAVDQISYLTRETHPFIYFHPDELFKKNDDKFQSPGRIKIVHAPSSPLIKGTQLIRAAIKKLKMLEYDFDYVEIINCKNSVVLEHLQSAHIVVNELYAFVPGVFGIEAMASHCALITSADRLMEPTLFEGANDAWFVTRYWEIFDHLKMLLDHPQRIKEYADHGFDWSLRYASVSQARVQIKEILGISG